MHEHFKGALVGQYRLRSIQFFKSLSKKKKKGTEKRVVYLHAEQVKSLPERHVDPKAALLTHVLPFQYMESGQSQ